MVRSKYELNGLLLNFREIEVYIDAYGLDYGEFMKEFVADAEFSAVGGIILTPKLLGHKFPKDETILDLLQRSSAYGDFFIGLHVEDGVDIDKSLAQF